MAYSQTKFVGVDEARENNTKLFVGVIVTIALLCIGYLIFLPATPAHTVLLAGSSVKVELSKGHGSGVHIGDGLILTAAHVASEGEVVKLKLDDSSERPATVLWANKANDVALLRTSVDGLASSPLSCTPVVMGQSIHATGNPLELEFITTYGHIIGQPALRADWAAAVPVDLTLLPGMSGGPVFDDAGEVVGISVGVMTAPAQFGYALTGIGMVVPSSVVCALLGRN